MFDDAINIYLNAPPAWQWPKPCAVCREDFIPADPRQECCSTHQRAFLTVRDAERIAEAQ